jgi:hypothetical protein
MIEIKTILEDTQAGFDEAVNILLKDDYRIISSNCFAGGNHEDGFVEKYQAILLKETVPIGKEAYSLTLPKDEIFNLLYIMCLGCKSEGCDFCFFRNLFPEFEENCPFQDDAIPQEGSVYFDMAVSRNLIRRCSS